MDTVKSSRLFWEHSSLIVSRIQTEYSRPMGTITQRELRELFESFRFRAAALLIFLLMLFSAVLYSHRYKAEQDTHRELLAGYQEVVSQVSVKDLAMLPHPMAKPPWKLAFLVDGQQQQVPNVYRLPLSRWQEPWLDRARPSEDRLPSSEPLDWAFLIRVVLSLVAFILSYDSICGSRQRATLKIILSYPIERWQVLLAKVTALWVALSAPFFCGALGSLVILRFAGNLRLTWAELVKVGEVLLLGLWASLFFVAIGVLVSLLSREASRSLALLTMIWITMVIVIPAASGLLAHQIQPVPSRQEIDQRANEIKEEVEERYGSSGSWRSPKIAAKDGYTAERRAAVIQSERYALQEDHRREVLLLQFSQIEIAKNLAAISPMQLTQDIAERLVGSGSLRDRLFVERAWRHSERLFAHAEEMDRLDPESPGLYFFPDFMSTKKPTDLPPIFEFEEISISSGLLEARGRILLFGLATLFFAALIFILFANHQVG